MGLEVGLEVNPLAASKFFFLLVSYWTASILPTPDKYAILIYKVASRVHNKGEESIELRYR